MKIQEAIERIKENYRRCNGFECCKYGTDCTGCLEAIDMAIEALEKQIPKKPTDIRYFGMAGHYIGLCPCCSCGSNSEYNYCGDCGQALDWKVEVC